jgi:hypothetical protein
MSYTKAYQQGQLAALYKLGFAHPVRMHGLAGAALGGTVGALQSDEHPVRDALIGGAIGGTAGALGKILINESRFPFFYENSNVISEALERKRLRENSLLRAIEDLKIVPANDRGNIAYNYLDFSKDGLKEQIRSHSKPGSTVPPLEHLDEIRDQIDKARADYERAREDLHRVSNRYHGWF